MPQLAFYDDKIILQTVLNTEGQHAYVTNALRFSCYSCSDLFSILCKCVKYLAFLSARVNQNRLVAKISGL